MKSRLFRIYLAGPISGCNEKQIHAWRNNIIKKYGNKFLFENPADKIYERIKSNTYVPYNIVKDDLESIARADALLVNMWKESIGTAIGVVHAKNLGKPVVVVDHNHIDSTTLAFYADAIFSNVNEAMDQIKRFLELDTLCSPVHKRGKKHSEQFDRKKLIQSVRNACQAADQNDILTPLRLMPKVYDYIYETRKKLHGAIFTTTNIRQAVFDALVYMESNDKYGDEFKGISSAWKKYDDGHKTIRLSSVDDGEVKISTGPLHVQIGTAKSHTSIWGHKISTIDDIPDGARQLFSAISRVHGISRIVLRTMSEGPKTVNKPYIELSMSESDEIIEGVCYDQGKKGHAQAFQIFVPDNNAKGNVKSAIEAVLNEL